MDRDSLGDLERNINSILEILSNKNMDLIHEFTNTIMKFYRDVKDEIDKQEKVVRMVEKFIEKVSDELLEMIGDDKYNLEVIRIEVPVNDLVTCLSSACERAKLKISINPNISPSISISLDPSYAQLSVIKDRFSDHKARAYMLFIIVIDRVVNKLKEAIKEISDRSKKEFVEGLLEFVNEKVAPLVGDDDGN